VTVKVKVQNFQSIEDAEIDVSGFTVVTGKNNGGKSALMRAFRGVFQNTKGSGYVRYGKPKSMVTLDLGDDHTVYWEKGLKSKPTYIVDNGNPIHPGRAVPTEVSDLGVRPIRVGNQDIWPQFAPQFTGQIFLLDQPGSVLAEAVADVDRVSLLNQALRLSESDRRAANSELKIRRGDKEGLEEDLKRFEGVDDVITFVETLEADVVKITRIENVLVQVRGLHARYASATAEVTRLEGIENVVVPGSELDVLGVFSDEISEVTFLYERFTRTSGEVTRLKGVEKIKLPDAKKLDTLSNLLEKAAETRVLHNRYQKASGEVSLLEDVEAITLDDADSSKAERLITAIDMTQGLFSRYTAAIREVLGYEASIVVAENEAAEAQVAVVVCLKELGQCPVCDSIIAG